MAVERDGEPKSDYGCHCEHDCRCRERSPTLQASPLFNTPMKGMPAPANRDHKAKTKYAPIRGCSFLDRAALSQALTVHGKPERTRAYYPVVGNRAGIRSRTDSSAIVLAHTIVGASKKKRR